MSTVVFVKFNEICDRKSEIPLKDVPPEPSRTKDTIEREYACQVARWLNVKITMEQWRNLENRFVNTFLKDVTRNTTTSYFFIIARDQMALWEEHLDRYQLREAIIYQENDIPNRNYYREENPRLNIYILNFANWSK